MKDSGPLNLSRTKSQLNPHTMLGVGIKPRSQPWEESALTTVPSPLPHTAYGISYLAFNDLKSNNSELNM